LNFIVGGVVGIGVAVTVCVTVLVTVVVTPGPIVRSMVTVVGVIVAGRIAYIIPAVIAATTIIVMRIAITVEDLGLVDIGISKKHC